MGILEEKSQAVTVLQRAGITNPLRLPSLIRRQVDFLQLDLSGITVLTEAASGPYVVTPVIASLAGAKRVIAITHDSNYATIDEVIAQTRALEILCNVKTAAEIHTTRSLDLFPAADIVTNLGFLRPLDKAAIFAMKPTAVIPLMCEAWEIRPGDVDFEVCNLRDIPVMGTNEDFPGLEVFSYSGFLCAKLLFEAQIEIHKSNIMVVSSDKFGVVITDYLKKSGANIKCVGNLQKVSREEFSNLDALVVADYTRSDTIIGEGGDITTESFISRAAGVTIVQFAGKLDVKELIEKGVCVYPGVNLDAHRMAQTLAYLGPRPVIELHAAGLKVGELLLKRRGMLWQNQSDNQYDRICAPLNKPTRGKNMSDELNEKKAEIQEYYRVRAGSGKYATSPDFNLREVEIDYLSRSMKNGLRILDAGCGNGYSTLSFASQFASYFIGVDFVSEMIDQANVLSKDFQQKGEVEFRVGDVTKLEFPDTSFDIVVSERCLLNLPTKNDQWQAIREVARVVKPGGLYLMLEGTMQGLQRLNEVRAHFNLDPIPEADPKYNWFSNKFDEDEMIPIALRSFDKLELIQRFGMYYFISRVINPLLVKPDQPKYDAPINMIARQISNQYPNFEDIGHVALFVFKR